MLSYQASVLTDNRHGLVVLTVVDPADGPAVEVAQAEQMLQALAAARACGVTPHIAQVTHRTSAIDGRTTRHAGYGVSQRRRKRIEQTFGWGKTVGLLRKLRHRGRETVDWVFTFAMAAYNLVRMGTLIRQGVGA